MKICIVCKEEKILDDFHNDKNGKDGKDRRCKPCKSNYMSKYASGESVKAKRLSNKKAFLNRNRDYVKSVLQNTPCADCKNNNWIVLEFDHLQDKLYNISNMMSLNSLAKIKKEIEKCEVVCKNCHTIRTHCRSNSWRVA